MTTDPTALALLATITSHPEEDTPRLVLADWYDEHEQPEQACEQRLAVCLRKVKAAKEDDGPRLEYAEVCERYERKKRAEFIRVQCELVKTPKELPLGQVMCNEAGLVVGISRDVIPNPRYKELQDRQRKLLSYQNHKEWFPRFMEVNAVDMDWYLGKFPIGHASRGFIDSAHVTFASWLEGGDAIVVEYPIEQVRFTMGMAWGQYRDLIRRRVVGCSR